MVGKNLKWIEVSMSVDAGTVERVVSVLNQYGYGGAVIEEYPNEKNSIVKAFLPCNRSLKAKKCHLEDSLKKLYHSNAIPLRERLLEPEEWLSSWKEHFGVLEIGEKLVVKPRWLRHQLSSANRKVIELEPGIAFGTGLHPTTRLCLLGIEKHLKPGISVLDLGTGSGILAIAAAKLGASYVLALDNDPVAVKVAGDNLMTNGVSKTVQVSRGTLTAKRQRSLGSCFDLVVANITSAVIARLAKHFAPILKPTGRLVVSGISAQGLNDVLTSFTSARLGTETIDSEGEWYAITASITS